MRAGSSAVAVYLDKRTLHPMQIWIVSVTSFAGPHDLEEAPLHASCLVHKHVMALVLPVSGKYDWYMWRCASQPTPAGGGFGPTLLLVVLCNP